MLMHARIMPVREDRPERRDRPERTDQQERDQRELMISWSAISWSSLTGLSARSAGAHEARPAGAPKTGRSTPAHPPTVSQCACGMKASCTRAVLFVAACAVGLSTEPCAAVMQSETWIHGIPVFSDGAID